MTCCPSAVGTTATDVRRGPAKAGPAINVASAKIRSPRINPLVQPPMNIGNLQESQGHDKVLPPNRPACCCRRVTRVLANATAVVRPVRVCHATAPGSVACGIHPPFHVSPEGASAMRPCEIRHRGSRSHDAHPSHVRAVVRARPLRDGLRRDPASHQHSASGHVARATFTRAPRTGFGRPRRARLEIVQCHRVC